MYGSSSRKTHVPQDIEHLFGTIPVNLGHDFPLRYLSEDGRGASRGDPGFRALVVDGCNPNEQRRRSAHSEWVENGFVGQVRPRFANALEYLSRADSELLTRDVICPTKGGLRGNLDGVIHIVTFQIHGQLKTEGRLAVTRDLMAAADPLPFLLPAVAELAAEDLRSA